MSVSAQRPMEPSVSIEKSSESISRFADRRSCRVGDPSTRNSVGRYRAMRTRLAGDDINWRLTLLTARELLNSLLLVMFTIETDADAYTSIILHGLSSLFVLRVIVSLSCRAIGSPLDDESSATGRNERGEDARECFRDTTEGSFNGLMKLV